MRMRLLVMALFVGSCHSAVQDPGDGQAVRSAESQSALDQILREINAGDSPVGVLPSPPTSTDEAVAALMGMDLAETTRDAPSVTEYKGFLICSWAPLENPYWGQQGYAVKRETGQVYEWSLW